MGSGGPPGRLGVPRLCPLVPWVCRCLSRLGAAPPAGIQGPRLAPEPEHPRVRPGWLSLGLGGYLPRSSPAPKATCSPRWGVTWHASAGSSSGPVFPPGQARPVSAGCAVAFGVCGGSLRPRSGPCQDPRLSPWPAIERTPGDPVFPDVGQLRKEGGAGGHPCPGPAFFPLEQRRDPGVISGRDAFRGKVRRAQEQRGVCVCVRVNAERGGRDPGWSHRSP